MNKAFMTYREECERLREELQAAREEVSALLSVRDKQEDYMANQGKQLAAAKAEIERLNTIIESNIDDGIDKILAMSDEQISALAGYEGRSPDDQATIARQCMDIAMLKTELAARDLVIKPAQKFIFEWDLARSSGEWPYRVLQELREALAVSSTEALEEFVQKAIEHSAVMRAARLLYSWASNWNSEFMNDPGWINEDGPLVRKALNISTV